MSVKFKDYYEVLGVKRGASSDAIQKSYRKLARKYHPDVNKSKGAEKRIREINEAYEALHDPEKRERYDTLGANWKTGQDFTPPPGWENVRFQQGFGDMGGSGGASDFFRSLFGNLGGSGGFDGFEGFTSPGGHGRNRFRSRGENLHGQIEITLNEAYHGAKKKIHLQSPTRRPDGMVVMESHTYDVTAPRGVTSGSKIRLAGRGAPGVGDGPPGDLLLTVTLKPDRRFKVHNHDLKTTIQVTPWEAALGADLQVETLDGKVKMKLPAGTQGGQTLRLRERGLPRIRGKQGDLLATIKIAIPKDLTTEERELFEQLAEKSKFSPRDE